MKVALVIAQTEGGIGRHVASLIPELIRRDMNVRVVGPEQTRRFEFEAAGATFVPLEISRGLHPIGDRRAAALLSRHIKGMDLVHAHGVRAGFVSSISAPRSGIGLFLTTIHNKMTSHSPLNRIAFKLVDRRLAHTTATRIYVSSDLASEAAEGSPKMVIPAGAALRMPTPVSAAESLRDIPIAPDSRFVLSVGRLHPQKGFKTLIEAAKLVEDQTINYLIAGEGPLRSFLLDTIRVAGLENRFHLLGDRSDAPELMMSCSIFCMPSVWEGSPLALHEAMACGCSIIATRVGGIPSMIRDSETGLLIRPDDPQGLAAALSRLLTDEAFAKELANNARKAATELPDAAATAVRIADLYEELSSSSLIV